MKINLYRLELKHDNGIYFIQVPATSKDSAINIIMEAESCPERAILSIEEI